MYSNINASSSNISKIEVESLKNILDSLILLVINSTEDDFIIEKLLLILKFVLSQFSLWFDIFIAILKFCTIQDCFKTL